MKNSTHKIARAMLDVLERVAKQEKMSAPDIMHEMVDQISKQRVHPVAMIYTARELSPALRTRIQHFLEKRLGIKDMQTASVIDVGVVGGFMARIGDTEFDFSIRSALKKMRAYV